MHRLGNMILKSGREILDLPENYQILVEKEQRKPIFRDATNLAGYNVEKWKNTAECRLKGNCVKTNGEKCKICDEYKNLLRKSARVDYDDLILLACDILEKNEKIRKEWKLKTKYLLVDEYQDINEAQCKLIQLLSKDQEDGLFVVGDDEQSIYSFRGGSTKFIANFDKYFPNNPKVGELFVSWRCSQHILLGARSMINNFYKKALPKPKPKFSAKIETNNKIVFYEVPSEGLEAYIISKIAKEKIKTNSIKIIIPNKKYFPILKKTLQKFGLNYRYKFNINQEGLIRFTILTDWLKNKDDNILFRYLIDLIIQNYDDLSKKVNEEKYGIILKRMTANELIAGLWKKVDKKNSLYKVFIKDSNNNSFFKELKKNLDDLEELIETKGTKRDGLLNFLNTSGLFFAPGKNPLNLVAEIKEWANELIEGTKDKSDEPIMIYNMPSSKGLEADIIFVVGLSKELFPNKTDDIEEKSRLFYVAMTRAKKELYLFSSRTRSAKITFNKASYQLEPSPFISMICKDNIDIRKVYPKK